MKRMHMHVSVDDLAQSVGFYSALFGTKPTVEKPDYAKWMLDDPRVNFAISQRGVKPGLDHVGIQVDNESELNEIKARMDAADMATLSQASTTCCYARSDKHWVQDPSGIAWEAYHTLDSAPTFNNADSQPADGACCTPQMNAVQFISRKNHAKSCK